ncbi:type IV pilus assembly protein PilE [Neisseria sp. HSC-16F19]|nr:PilX family type IV pilin [Neisseria sp. HSC-16F19]MCP2040295.1 type IV pilus assembly protein PilE [Neisseria sp. HSC-16F19]
MMQYKHNRGFTLVEIIIAIAIVGILAVIAIPAYDSYREKADLEQARTNLTTINQMIAREKIKGNLTGATIQNTFNLGLSSVDTNVSARYDVAIRCGDTHASCSGNDNILTYHLFAVPKTTTGRSRSLWISHVGNTYLCSQRLNSYIPTTNSNGCELRK